MFLCLYDYIKLNKVKLNLEIRTKTKISLTLSLYHLEFNIRGRQ